MATGFRSFLAFWLGGAGTRGIFAYFPVYTLMRSTPVPAIGMMATTAVAVIGNMP